MSSESEESILRTFSFLSLFDVSFVLLGFDPVDVFVVNFVFGIPLLNLVDGLVSECL